MSTAHPFAYADNGSNRITARLRRTVLYKNSSKLFCHEERMQNDSEDLNTLVAKIFGGFGGKIVI